MVLGFRLRVLGFRFRVLRFRFKVKVLGVRLDLAKSIAGKMASVFDYSRLQNCSFCCLLTLSRNFIEGFKLSENTFGCLFK